jgi:hypothetical protein
MFNCVVSNSKKYRKNKNQDPGGNMGRKGVSKRKPSKSKNPKASSGGVNGTSSSIERVSESPTPQLIAKGEAISTGKRGGKKK